ncbi:hypothetical protein JCGZ_26563 [Jatropha curcas]|uniref:Uncharacterized protein n=1 Tax=Jatropha curcas TaxID=180498 RepID=A0A067JKZ2_JATCU|nr:hypothetical protein JCGZ_26563 [Jatropha curcas]
MLRTTATAPPSVANLSPNGSPLHHYAVVKEKLKLACLRKAMLKSVLEALIGGLPPVWVLMSDLRLLVLKSVFEAFGEQGCSGRCLRLLDGGFDADTSVMTLPRGRAWKFNLKYVYTTLKISMFRQLSNGLSWDQVVKYPWGDVADYPDFVQAAIVYQQKRLLLSGLFYDMYFLGERQQRDKSVRGGSYSRALDMAVVVGKLEHGPGASFSFILDCTGQTAQGMLETHLVSLYQMSPPGCTHVSQLYKVARLKLTVVRLSDEHVSHGRAIWHGLGVLESGSLASEARGVLGSTDASKRGESLATSSLSLIGEGGGRRRWWWWRCSASSVTAPGFRVSYKIWVKD